ncbi:MAG: helix-turn-helix domain-containing protein [Verrucomicrobia bacterium]|nr:helix-turn-helix domain-containing protein [Verrucomicrobiota bacterium]
MSAMEDLMQAALAAPQDRREEALRVLRGEARVADITAPTVAVEPYLTLRDISRRLGLCTVTLWRWQIPGHDLGGRRRFRLSEVKDYLESDAFKRRMASLRAERRPSPTRASK